MLLRSLPGRGAAAAVIIIAAAAVTTALLPASTALAATLPTPTATATVVTTTPSAGIGGLPASSLDGKVEYLPATGASSAGPKASNLAPTFGSSGGAAATGYDVSWPQCGGPMPSSSAMAIVGVDDGHPFSQNPCLQQELQWASTATQRGLYMVVDSPVGWSSARVSEYADYGPAGDCASTDYVCQSYNWGYNAAYADVAYAESEGATSPQWWLDVELPTSTSINPSGADCDVANFWVCDPKLNSTVVLAAAAALREQGKQVGVYSTQSQWQAITGGLPLAVPIWIAGYDYGPTTYCDPANAATYWFASGDPALVQSIPTAFDPDTSCSTY